ncbi:YbjN domain-containing protein [Hymenobacter sp. BT664]|uniref:YbjN domain-containing protein n=1 Tax=Hymenobacter montanus TaxID=2771359 RepID=A0A927BFJ8_9BACT|nr:YbjN domain-containing protein [Hymenobacter montanus]MBD2769158.1 YbjN domain-containing protein [Hymenobacter montanus]
MIENKGKIFQKIVKFFKEDDWEFIELEEEPILRMEFPGQNGQLNCYAKARESQQQFVFYSICPIKVPENKRLEIAEFLTRANFGMVFGNFELDFANGEIRYKTNAEVENDNLSSALIGSLVYGNVMMMDHYLPGIMSVINGNVLPVDAIAQIE